MCLVLLLAGTSVAADFKAEDVVAYRQQVFGGMAKHMRAGGMIAKGQVEPTKEDRILHAKALHQASKVLGNLFAEGTGPDKTETEALPAIWSDPSGFQEAVAAYAAATEELVKVAENGDAAAFKTQFGKVGRTCGGCHETFRKDDN
jgi:cytochrome c556